MNRAKYLQPTRTYYEGNYDGVWIVEYNGEFYRVTMYSELFQCHFLFDENYFESTEIKNRELIAALQALIVTECFRVSEQREEWHKKRKT